LPRLLAAISAEAGALFMQGRKAGILVCSACSGPVDIAGAEVPIASSLAGKVFSDGKTRSSSGLQQTGQHDRRIDRQTGLQTRSALTVPVALGTERFGAQQAINKKTGKKGQSNKPFSRQDANRLHALAGVLGLAIANMKLARQAVQDRLLEHDLEQAGQVQKMMLPAPDPAGRLAGLMLPAPVLGGQLAGDFFSWHKTRAGHAFCLGDISGKGMGRPC
jgi:sigma-B regulation protein RsbU (phosphoserine phosphatase)